MVLVGLRGVTICDESPTGFVVSRLLVDILLISYLKLMNHDINIVITVHFLTEKYLLKKILRKDKHMQKLLRKAFR